MALVWVFLAGVFLFFVTNRAEAKGVSDGLAPAFLRKIDAWLTAVTPIATRAGYTIRWLSGLRTTEEQNRLYQLGRTVPNPGIGPEFIVTNADGVFHKSNHQARADGYGHARDFVLDAGGHAVWWDRKIAEAPQNIVYRKLAEYADRLGLKSGFYFTSPFDPGHLEDKT